MFRRHLTIVLIAFLGLGSAAVTAQEPPDRPGRRVAPAPAAEARVEPRPMDPDADHARLEAFHGTLGSLSAEARRRARIEVARRVADFDLDWGLD